MHANLAEVVSRAWLHPGQRGRIQRLAGRTQNVMHNWEKFGRYEIVARLALKQPFLLRALRTLSASTLIAAGALALQYTLPRQSRTCRMPANRGDLYGPRYVRHCCHS